MADVGAAAVAVGALAVGLELVFAWPQAYDALRAPDVTGISPVTAMLMVLTGLSWLGYGVAVGDPVVIVANAVMLVATSVIAGALVRRQALPPSIVAAVVAPWAVAITGAWLLAGAPALGAVGAVLGISMGLPQAAHAIRSGSVAGVAISSYVLLTTLQAAWLVYGLLVADAVIVVPNVIALPVSLSVVAVLLARRRATDRSRDELTTEPVWGLAPEPLES